MLWKKADSTPVITPDDLALLLNEGRAPVLVDVRSAKDYHKAHLTGAIHIPLNEPRELDPTLPTVFY